DEFRSWGVLLFLRWARAELESARFSRAADVIAQGRRDSPNDRLLANYLAYVVQQSALASGNVDDAENLLADALKRYEDVPEVKRAATGYVLATVTLLLKKDDYEGALKFVKRFEERGLLKGDISASDISARINELRAASLPRNREISDLLAAAR